MMNDNQKEIEKLENLLKAKVELKIPEWKEDLLFQEPKYVLKDQNISSLIYKIAAIVFFIFFIGIYYFYNSYQRNQSSKKQNVFLQENQAIGIVLLAKGENFIIDKTNQKKKIFTGNLIYPYSKIETENQSKVEILLDKRIHIRIDENTSILINYENLHWEIKQLHGISYHNVMKIHNKENYLVETPTIIAGVRGTFFKVQNQNHRTIIEVLNGIIDIYKIQKNEEDKKIIIQEDNLKENQSIEFYENKKILKKDAKNQKLFVIYNDMNQNLNLFSNELWEEVKKIPSTKNEKEIEEVYNKRLEIILLKDGRRMQGIIASQIGNKLILHTTEGIFVVNTEDIKEIIFKEN